jgi:hypothetical protein
MQNLPTIKSSSRRSYGSVVEAPLVSGGLPHVLTPGSLKRSLLRVRLGSAFASRSFRPIEMSSQRRMRGAVHAMAQNEAHSNCHRRRQEQAPVGFQHGPAPTAHSGLWSKKGVQGECLLRLKKCGRYFAGPIAPLIDGCMRSLSAPRRSAILQWDPVGHRTSTRLSMRSWPTSCSSSSTSGRRSTSRRPALTPRWTPERVRLPRQRCLAADRVTVACAHVRPVVATALGRSHAVGATEGGQ